VYLKIGCYIKRDVTDGAKLCREHRKMVVGRLKDSRFKIQDSNRGLSIYMIFGSDEIYTF
jgi:hypothetical protein